MENLLDILRDIILLLISSPGQLGQLQFYKSPIFDFTVTVFMMRTLGIYTLSFIQYITLVFI